MISLNLLESRKRVSRLIYLKKYQQIPQNKLSSKEWHKNYTSTEEYKKKMSLKRKEPENIKKHRLLHSKYRLTKKYINSRIAYSHTDEFRTKRRAYNSRPYVVEKRRVKAKIRRHSDVNAHLRYCLRSRYSRLLKRKHNGSAIRDMGCTISELKQHLQALFKPGMTWENHSSKGWHIDHIKPLFSFDLNDKNQFLQAINYKNLQPLWAFENLSKSKSLTNNVKMDIN